MRSTLALELSDGVFAKPAVEPDESAVRRFATIDADRHLSDPTVGASGMTLFSGVDGVAY